MPARATPLSDSQLTLADSVQTVHATGGRRIKALLRKAIADNRIPHSALAHELGMDESHLSRALGDDKGAHPSPAVFAAVLALDAQRILISGLAEMVGCEVIRRAPDPAERIRKLESALAAAVAALQEATR